MEITERAATAAEEAIRAAQAAIRAAQAEYSAAVEWWENCPASQSPEARKAHAAMREAAQRRKLAQNRLERASAWLEGIRSR